MPKGDIVLTHKEVKQILDAARHAYRIIADSREGGSEYTAAKLLHGVGALIQSKLSSAEAAEGKYHACEHLPVELGCPQCEEERVDDVEIRTMTDKKAPELPWNNITRISEGVLIQKYVPGDITFADQPHLRHELFAAIPEAEARELWDLKQEHQANQQRVDMWYREAKEAKAERDKLREALGVAKEALGKCRDLPMPLFIDGVMVASEALARIDSLCSSPPAGEAEKV